MSVTKRPISVSILSWFLIITSGWSLLYIPFSLNSPASEKMLQAAGVSPLVAILLSLLSGGVNITAGIGMLKRIEWGRRLYVLATPVLLLASVALYGFKLFAVYLIALVVYAAFCVLLTRRPVSEYFSATPSTESPSVDIVTGYSVDQSESGRKIASVILLIPAGFILNAWFMMMLPMSESLPGMIIASSLFGGLACALVLPAIFLWGRKRWAVVLGTLLASVGGVLLMIWLLLYQFTSMAEFQKEFAKIDPGMLERMTRGSLMFGLLAAVVGALLIVLQREKDMEALQTSGMR